MMTNSHQYARPVFSAWYAKHNWISSVMAPRIGIFTPVPKVCATVAPRRHAGKPKSHEVRSPAVRRARGGARHGHVENGRDTREARRGDGRAATGHRTRPDTD